MSNNSDKKTSDIFPAFEFKSKSRFIAKFKDSSGEFLPSFVIQSIDRPRFTQDTRGKIMWFPLDVKLYDPIVPSTAQSLFTHISKNERFNITIELLGPVGDVVEKWEIANAHISNVNFGTLRWSSTGENTKFKIEQPNLTYLTDTDPLIISLEIQYEYAKLIF